MQFLARAPHDATWLLWTIIAGQLIMAGCVWRLHVQPPALISTIGIALAGLVLPALAAFLYSAWNDPTKRRTIGVLWDVGTFWPRSYHPLSPPCYTERAVPDLQRRMWWLHDNGGRVVLVGHSQGAVLTTAALLQPDCRPEGDQPAMVTFGSPVGKLYGWGFPAYFTLRWSGHWCPAAISSRTAGSTSITRPIRSAARSRIRRIGSSPTRPTATSSTARPRPRPRGTPGTGRTAASGA